MRVVGADDEGLAGIFLAVMSSVTLKEACWTGILVASLIGYVLIPPMLKRPTSTDISEKLAKKLATLYTKLAKAKAANDPERCLAISAEIQDARQVYGSWSAKLAELEKATMSFHDARRVEARGLLEQAAASQAVFEEAMSQDKFEAAARLRVQKAEYEAKAAAVAANRLEDDYFVSRILSELRSMGR